MLTEDIPRNAVLILVLIAVIVSIASTALVLNAVYTYVPEQTPSVPSGRVTFTVPANPSASGRVSFEVVNPEQVEK